MKKTKTIGTINGTFGTFELRTTGSGHCTTIKMYAIIPTRKPILVNEYWLDVYSEYYDETLLWDTIVQDMKKFARTKR